MSTLERVKNLFVEKLDLNVENLHPEATIESLGLDSLDRIEFMFDLENEFKIKIPESGLKIETIADMINMVDKFVTEQQGK